MADVLDLFRHFPGFLCEVCSGTDRLTETAILTKDARSVNELPITHPVPRDQLLELFHRWYLGSVVTLGYTHLRVAFSFKSSGGMVANK